MYMALCLFLYLRRSLYELAMVLRLDSFFEQYSRCFFFDFVSILSCTCSLLVCFSYCNSLRLAMS